MQKRSYKLFTLLSIPFFAFHVTALFAQELKINEILNNPTGDNNTQEFIEIKSREPHFDLSKYSLIVISGDDREAGTILNVISLKDYKTGENGFALIRDDEKTLKPAPSSATNTFVQDFRPDLSNGTVSFLLVNGFSGKENEDIDSDDDGNFDISPWEGITDAISITDGGGSDIMYAERLGFTNLGRPRLPYNGVVRNMDDRWLSVYLDSGSPMHGSYNIKALTNENGNDANIDELPLLTPGNENRPITVLAVEFASFSAKNTEGGVNVAWRVANGKNIAFFDVERSFNGNKFEAIGRILPLSKDMQNIDFQYFDNNLNAGLRYYRIKETATNEKTTVSKTVALEIGKSAFQFKLGSTIVYHNLTILRTDDKVNNTNYRIFDLNGRQILRGVFSTKADIDVANLASGLYVVQVGESTIFKFLKM